MTQNFLNYANLSYDEIVSQVNDKLQADSRFANFRESSIAKMMVEIFAATAELMTHTIERRAEESFFDTAKIRGSTIALSRQLGYSTQRAVSAQAKLKIKIKGSIHSDKIGIGDVIQIPIQSSFSYGDLTFILKKTFSVGITSQMITDMDAQGTAYEKTFEVDYADSDIYIIEGQIKEKIFTGTTNVLVGQNFQKYTIDDTTFSNSYAEDDFENPLTRVWVGANKSSDEEFTIDKRSLINWQTVTEISSTNIPKVCLIRSSTTEGVDLLFGDGVFADRGARSSEDNIYVQYLSTKGSKGNKTGLIDEKLTYSGSVIINGEDVTDKFEFYFKTNPVGGGDMESIESIKMNAPAIYYTLNRLVNSKDYVNYLKSLTYPIVIKNALAWGEQEELLKQSPILQAQKKMFNVVMFSCLGSLYQTDTSPYYPRETGKGIEDAVLDANFNEDDISIRSYFNIYVRENIIDQQKDYLSQTIYNSINGTTSSYFSTPATIDNLSALDGNPINLYFTYNSDSHDVGLEGVSNISVDKSGMGAPATVKESLDILASRITTGLRAFVDDRGLTGINTNKGQPAFPTVTCYYSSATNTLNVSGTNSEPCYINDFFGDFASYLGLSGQPNNKLLATFSEPISEKILTVLNNIKQRSQITVNDVYVSPIIHSFKLVGKVYVDSLYDLVSVQTEINDSIYKFLDVNADFNTPIYLSNIIQLIEDVKGVKYADVGFDVNYPTPTLSSFYAEVGPLISACDTAYGAGGDIINGIDNINVTLDAMKDYTAYPNELLTTRKFYEVIKDEYDVLLNDYDIFVNSADYLTIVSALYKDYVRYIRNNLINTNGDIGQEVIQADLITPMYGYSLGSEIARLKSNLTLQYKA